jgi:uncharacterized MAPEG superfamily protein
LPTGSAPATRCRRPNWEWRVTFAMVIFSPLRLVKRVTGNAEGQGGGTAMGFAYWMVFVAALLPYVSVGLAKTGGVSNHTPRDGLEALTGWRRRADWAHRNHFEAFPAFAASVIIAHLAAVPPSMINGLAGTFVLARIGYTLAYLADRPTVRSVIWTLGFACVAGLLVAAALA